MSSYDIDLEKQEPIVKVNAVPATPDLEKPQPTVKVDDMPITPAKEKRNTLKDLETYQLLVGNIENPASPGATADHDLYNQLLHEERSASRWYILSSIAIYTLIAAQIILCLGITIGSQVPGSGNNDYAVSRQALAILAGVNTGVATAIGVLKGFGLPDKMDAERVTLRRLISRIRVTANKLKAGFEVDPAQEYDAVRVAFEGAEDAARFESVNVLDSTTAAMEGAKKNYASQVPKGKH